MIKITHKRYRAPNGRYYRSRNAYLRQLKAMFANMNSSYKRKGRKRQLHSNLPQSIKKKKIKTKTMKKRKVLTVEQKRKIAEKELQEIKDDFKFKLGLIPEYDVRYTENLNTMFVPSKETFENLRPDFFELPVFYDQFIDYHDEYNNITEEEYYNLLDEAEDNKKLQKKFLEVLENENYTVKFDKRINNYVLEANDLQVNANPTSGQYVESFRYKIYFKSTGGVDNIFSDGNLVKPTKLMAVYDQKEKRFLTADELKKIKFDKRGVQPKIYQLEQNRTKT